ncbi:hypothetical protein F5Y18DRAFT_432131 [Xylariaceae sp. FL1019]|nr:hypothetical protein F5Y18DRAFT_432131 [Xylariaceae sp. FL1019]
MPNQNSYKRTPEYLWYIARDASGNRCDGLPPHISVDNVRMELGRGELFCRVGNGDGTLCKDNQKFRSRAFLSRHITSVHFLHVIKIPPGSLSAEGDRMTAEFYRNMYQFAHGQAVAVVPPVIPGKGSHYM